MSHSHRVLFRNLFSAVALTGFTAFVLLDTFVIPRSYAAADDLAAAGNAPTTQAESAAAAASSTAAAEDAYSADGISITLTTQRVNGTAVYTADVVLSDASMLKTVLAQNTYGRNITAVTSSIAADSSAILAVNGDFYGARNQGYVIRNGVLYRETSAEDDQEDLVIDADDDFSIIREGDVTAQELLNAGAQQVLSFGPGLVESGSICVDESAEVGRAKVSNPRTAIGEISPLHYVFVVADGRTDESAGLSLYELADFMQKLGVATAYNLDGGGSSTLYFNGTVVNQPTSGHGIKERAVSDIVAIG